MLTMTLSESQGQAAEAARLLWREKSSAGAPPPPAVPLQVLPGTGADRTTSLGCLMPPGSPGRRTFSFEIADRRQDSQMQVQRDAASGQYDLTDSAQRVLRYNYATIEPGDILDSLSPGNRIYARPRGNYLHPLYGPDGEVLTHDWSKDHPHHRGIYWAWPEVEWHGQRADLHALQKVFARPTSQLNTVEGPVFTQIDAENLWLWEDREPIVRERAIIRAWRAGPSGRWIDLDFRFTALKDGVTVARRDTKLYGGLNLRLAPVKDQQIVFFTDPATQSPRRAWAELSGVFPGGQGPVSLSVFQHPGNPDYPGDWVKYPEINWFQPTFPAAGTRCALKKDSPLRLRYRLWLHAGKADEKLLSQAWSAYARPVSIVSSK
jgi:hypothetical protein